METINPVVDAEINDAVMAEVKHVVETDEIKKKRNSPSKKIHTLEEKLAIHEEEMRNLRHYIMRLEDFFIHKLGGKKEDLKTPVSVLPDEKRILNLEPETEEENPVSVPEEPKKERKKRTKLVPAIPKPEGTKKRGRPKGSKNKPK